MILAIVAALCLPASVDPVQRLLEEAVALRARGDLEGTLAKLRAAEAIRPHFKISHNIGAVLEQLGRYGEANEAYQRVVRDPATPAEVAREDALRSGILEPKLKQAWVILRAPTPVLVYLDNEPVVLDEELGLAPGHHVLEVRRERRVELSFVDFGAGRRTVFELAEPSRAERAVLSVPPGTGPIEVGGYALRGSPEEIWLPPGEHQVRAGEGGATASFAAGTRQELSLLIQRTAVPETVAVEPPDRTVSYVVGGAGVAAALAGAVFLYLGEADRDRITERRGADGAIEGVTMREALVLDDRAATRTVAGGITLGGGAALVAVAALLFFSE